MSLTRLQLETRVLRTLEDTAGTFWTPAEVRDHLCDAVRVIATTTPIVRKVHTLVAETAYEVAKPYAYWGPPANTTIVRAYACWVDGLRVERGSVEAEYEARSNWEDQVGVPRVIIPGDYGFNRWRLAPYPAGTAVVKMLGSYLPVDMAIDGDVPGIPDPLHHYLHDYAVWKCLKRPGEGQLAEQAKGYRADWEVGLDLAGELAAEDFDGTPLFVAINHDWENG